MIKAPFGGGKGGIWKCSTFHLFFLKLKTVLKVKCVKWKKQTQGQQDKDVCKI